MTGAFEPGHDNLALVPPERIEALAGYGMPAAGIARIVGLDVDDLRARYSAELETGLLKANAKVAENLYRKATGEAREAVPAAIFWLKTRAGWKETSAHELSGRDGGPIETVQRSPRDIAKAIALALARARLAAETEEDKG